MFQALVLLSFRTLLADKTVILSGRKTRLDSNDQTLLTYLVIGTVVALVAAILGCVIYYLSAPRTVKDEAVPLIVPSASHSYQEQLPSAMSPNWLYWQPPYAPQRQTYFPQTAPGYQPLASTCSVCRCVSRSAGGYRAFLTTRDRLLRNIWLFERNFLFHS
jgi:hypothetical protein